MALEKITGVLLMMKLLRMFDYLMKIQLFIYFCFVNRTEETAAAETQPEVPATGGEEEKRNWAEETEKKEKEEPKEDEGPVMMTLDEYKAIKSQVQQKNQQFNIRQPGEGEESNRWGNTYVLQKKELDEEEDGEEEEEEEEEQGEEEGDEKQKLVEEIKKQLTAGAKYHMQPRGGPRGGSRGGPRGGDRGGDRPERRGENRGGEGGKDFQRRPKAPRTPNDRAAREVIAPKINDDKDFPSLSKA
jgi:hypothetical protein